MASMLDVQRLKQLDVRSFEANEPCPWAGIENALADDAFYQLNAEFPNLALFEKHRGRERNHEQRPHNRHYLALERSIYGNKKPGEPGCVEPSQLSKTWRTFVKEIQTSRHYLRFLREFLCVENPVVRFAWHVAGSGDDVSPHCDSASKAGTHIFYFNTSSDWQESWGGGTVFLAGKKMDGLNPEVRDFDRKSISGILDNRSLLFRNTPDAWHGVEPIRCPPGKHRRIFNVIVQSSPAVRPRNWLAKKWRTLLGKAA